MSGTTEFTGFTITRTTATRHQLERTQSGTRKTLFQLINCRLWCINGKSEHVRIWIFILEVFPASCTLCSSGNRTLGPQHCVAVEIRLMNLSRDEHTKVSRGTRKRRRLGPSAGRHAHFQRQAAAQEEPRREHEWRSHRSNVPLQTPSTIRRRVHQYSASKRSAACRGIVSFERDEHEEGSVLTSPEPKRPKLHMNSVLRQSFTSKRTAEVTVCIIPKDCETTLDSDRISENLSC